MFWFVYAILFAFFDAGTLTVNQRYRVDGYMLAAWRGFGVSLCALPFLFFVNLPIEWSFWLRAAMQGIFTGFLTSRLYNSVALFGAGATSRILVLSIVISALMWWGLHPEDFTALARNPALLIGIIASLAAAIYGYLRMSDHARSQGIVGYMALAVIVAAIISVNRKSLMALDGFLAGNTIYFLVSMFVSGVYNSLAYFIKTKCSIREFFAVATEIRSVKSGGIIALLSALSLFFCDYALSEAPNPAYVNAITLSSPLWVLVYNRFTGYKNNFRKSGLAIMLISTAILIALSEAAQN